MALKLLSLNLMDVVVAFRVRSEPDAVKVGDIRELASTEQLINDAPDKLSEPALGGLMVLTANVPPTVMLANPKALPDPSIVTGHDFTILPVTPE